MLQLLQQQVVEKIKKVKKITLKNIIKKLNEKQKHDDIIKKINEKQKNKRYVSFIL